MRVFPILFVALCEPRTALLASGLIARLKAEILHADITLITTPESAVLFQDDLRLGAIQVLRAPLFSLEGMKLVMGLKGRTYGLMVDIGQSALSEGPMSGIVRAKTRLRLKPDPAQHPAQLMAALLRLDDPIVPDLGVSEARLEGTRAFFHEDLSGQPLLVMAPGADWIGRRWPSERFASTAIKLLGEDGPMKGARLLIIGGEADRPAAMEVRMAAPRALVSELTGKLDLLTAYAALKGARAFVGNAGIWLHLAAAAGVTSFGLYGPDDAALDAPLGDHVHVIESPSGLEGIRVRDPGLNQALCHLADISVSRVCETVNAVLSTEATQGLSVAAE